MSTGTRIAALWTRSTAQQRILGLVTGLATAAAAMFSRLVDLAAARTVPTPGDAVQHFPRATGTGSLEAARGSVHVSVGGRRIAGEIDARGRRFDAAAVAAGIRSRTNWDGVSWSGVSWSGVSWSGVSWSGVSWSGVSWSAATWDSANWA